jgi:hypothetical protein
VSKLTGINARSRQREWERKRREARSGASNSALSASNAAVDFQSWPIVRAYAPIEDVFRATGFGSAGIVRSSPNGKWFTSYFGFSLSDAGITAMYGKDNTDETENAGVLNSLKHMTPAMEPAPPELAARYIWGAHALGLSAGNEFEPTESARYLGMVPKIAGRSSWWLQQFIGPGGLAAPGLVQFIKDHPVPAEIPEDKEVIVWTTATFECSNVAAITAKLRELAPEFWEDGDEDGVSYFTWSREYPKKHWSPLSKLGGRQILGSVQVHSHHLVADAKVLSMASILIAKLKFALGDNIKLRDTVWKGAKELIREAQADE